MKHKRSVKNCRIKVSDSFKIILRLHFESIMNYNDKKKGGGGGLEGNLSLKLTPSLCG